MEFSIQSVPKLLYKQFFETNGREPKNKIPVAPFDNDSFLSDKTDFQFIWYGHSVVLIRMSGLTILIDPMFGPNASPIAPFATNRFSDNTLAIIDNLPEIDIMLLTHDHYDHLDFKSIKKLIPEVKNYHVALGMARHLIQWGVPNQVISE